MYKLSTLLFEIFRFGECIFMIINLRKLLAILDVYKAYIGKFQKKSQKIIWA